MPNPHFLTPHTDVSLYVGMYLHGSPVLMEAVGFLEAGTTAIVSHLVWVVGTDLRSSVKAVCALTAEPFSSPHKAF